MIRPLTGDDIAAIATLSRIAESEGFRFVGRLLADATIRPACLNDVGEFYLAVVRDGAIVAVGGVTPDPYLDDPSTGRLRHLYVLPTARRGGLGQMLVAALEQRAGGRYGRLRLRTDTATAARFYERIGYTSTTDADATHVRELHGAQSRSVTRH